VPACRKELHLPVNVPGIARRYAALPGLIRPGRGTACQCPRDPRGAYKLRQETRPPMRAGARDLVGVDFG